MIKPRQLLRAWRLYKAGGPMGDFAVLKSDGLGARLASERAAEVAAVRGYAPQIDLALLRRMPEGSFGRAYARHMDDNRLQPIAVSPELRTELADNVFALRYPATHDMLHVLLGFDTSWAGEIGVLGFAAAQGTSRGLKLGFVLAWLLYPIFAPRSARLIWAHARRGRAMGRRAVFLLGVRLEALFERPLDQVRRELGISRTI